MHTGNDNQTQSPEEKNRVARLVQISDCHLGPTDEYCLAGVRTYFSFREVLDRLSLDVDKPDMIVATGDISAHGKEQAYTRFTRAMKDAGLPYIWLPGNHDDFAMMLEGLTVSAYCPVFDLENWCLLSLNTTTSGRVEGNLAESELAFLDHSLASEKDRHVALFMHHPPMDIGCRWLDRQQAANGEIMGEILRAHGNVRAIFTGHVHQQSSHHFFDIPLYTTPSTCFQFTPMQADFSVDSLPPAFRRINLYDNGDVETDVVWVEDTAEVVDTDIHGY